jgi:hypothetical protein
MSKKSRQGLRVVCDQDTCGHSSRLCSRSIARVIDVQNALSAGARLRRHSDICLIARWLRCRVDIVLDYV